LTIFLGVSAINTGNNLIYLIVAALLSFMGISGFFGKNNLSSVEVDIEFPQEIYARNEFPLKINLTNKKKTPSSIFNEGQCGRAGGIFPLY